MPYFDDENDPRLLAALLEYDEGRDVQAERLLRPLADEGNLTAMFKLGNVFSRTGRKPEAEELWSIAAREGDARAMNNVGTVLLGDGREEEALKIFRQAAAMGNREAAFNAASIFESRGDEAEFIATLERLGEAGWPRAWGRLGVYFLEREGQPSTIEAIRAFDRGIRLGSALCHIGMAVEAQRRRDYAGVRQWAEAALSCTIDEHEEQDGLRYQAHGMAGAACMLLGDYDVGLDHLAEAAKSGQPDDIEQYERMREHVRQLDTLGPSTPQVSAALSASIQTVVAFCPYCGQHAEQSHTFCGGCGQPLPK